MRKRDPETTKKERRVARFVATQVIACRLEKGWSQQELGRRSGLGQSTVSRMEKGDRMPRMTSLSHVATALGATLHDMLPLGHVPLIKAA